MSDEKYNPAPLRLFEHAVLMADGHIYRVIVHGHYGKTPDEDMQKNLRALVPVDQDKFCQMFIAAPSMLFALDALLRYPDDDRAISMAKDALDWALNGDFHTPWVPPEERK